MLIEMVYPTGSSSAPFLPDFKKSTRLHWLDTGLLNYAAGVQHEVFGAKELNSVWRGLVAEHIVGQELIAEDYIVKEYQSCCISQKPSEFHYEGYR